MAEYYSKEQLLECTKTALQYDMYDLEDFLEEVPTADVVEVVRCGKCKHWSCHSKGKLIDEKIGMCYNNEFPFHCEDRPIMRATDFCSYGERRTE